MTYKEAAEKYNHYIYLLDKYRHIGQEINEFYNNNYMYENKEMTRDDLMFMHETICEYLGLLKKEMDNDVK